MKNNYQILVFGELLWDLLPSGKKPGGAPANFAFHANVLGADARVNTKIGDDALGQEIMAILEENKLSTEFVAVDSNYPTGTVQVVLNESGQPSYTIVENVAWDHIQADTDLISFARQTDAFYFGSLAVRTAENLQTLEVLLNAVPQDCLGVFDLNLRAPFYNVHVIKKLLISTDVFKLNDDELVIIAGMFPQKEVPYPFAGGVTDLSRPEVTYWIQSFMNQFDLKTVILTAGAHGSYLFDRQGHSSFAPAQEVTIADTVGAGDSFTAVCVLGLLKQRPLDEINRKANLYAAYICSQVGAMPLIPDHLKMLYND